MKKIIEVLKNPAVTIFVWLIMGACYFALWTHSIKQGDIPQIGVMVLLTLSTGALFLRYKK